MGFNSGDAGGQFINRDPKTPILARYDIEFLAASEGELSLAKKPATFSHSVVGRGTKVQNFAVRIFGWNWNSF